MITERLKTLLSQGQYNTEDWWEYHILSQIVSNYDDIHDIDTWLISLDRVKEILLQEKQSILDNQTSY